jgi:hypothetical protein
LSDAASGLKELGDDTLGLDRADIGVQGQLGEGNVADGTKKPTRIYVVVRYFVHVSRVGFTVSPLR